MMKPEQQNIAIAEACGWKHLWSTEVQGWRGNNPDGSGDALISDCVNDLNACHKMEKVLQIPLGNYLCDTWWSYRSNLIDICERDHGTQDSDHIDATAAQRAEAFLKALNLWTTSE